MSDAYLDKKRVVILGAGASGQSAARWCVSRGAAVAVSDIRPLAEWPRGFRKWCETHDIFCESGENRPETCVGADLVIVSPGVPPAIPALRAARLAKVPVIGELGLALSFWKGPVLGITGTNGKTTTTALAGAMLRESKKKCVVAGNIGTPLTSRLEDAGSDSVAVVEISSFQLDSFQDMECGSFPPPVLEAAAWLNLAPDHLDRYGNIQRYGESKARIFDFQGPDDWAIFNQDDFLFSNWGRRAKARKMFFGTGLSDAPGAWCEREKEILSIVWMDGQREEYATGEWSLKGGHNLENLAAAALIARLGGASRAGVQEAIKSFNPLNHRLQWVASVNNVDFFDDSKATNVASVLKALDAMERPVILIAGGRGKGEVYMPLQRAAQQGLIRAAVLMGEDSGQLDLALSGVIPVVCINGEKNGRRAMTDAVRAASSVAEPGDAVLLSPACASFDLFENYEERGMVFQEAVLGLEITGLTA